MSTPGSVKIQLGRIKRFPADADRPDSDVLVIEVRSEQLDALNAKLRDEFSVVSKYPKFLAHVTLGYVKPGALPELDGQAPFDGEEIHCCEAVYSNGGRGSKRKWKIELTGDDRGISKAAALLNLVEPPTVLPMTKWASAEVPIPRTGPEAISAYLARLDLDGIEGAARDDIRSGRVTKRGRAVKMLNIVSGLRRNNLTPADMMISKVPVIPPNFRPFNLIGTTFLPGDANELYKDLIDMNQAYAKTNKLLGPEGSRDEFKALMQAVRAVHGYADSPNPKTAARGVNGFLKKVTGAHGPKTSYIHRRMLSKNQDHVGRGVIVPDPDLSMDEIGIPANQAWTTYADYIQRNLVRAGMAPAMALRQVKDRTPFALKALEMEMSRRPVVYSRSPAWYRFNVIAARPRLVEGDALRISPFVTTGLGADFDGDTANFHVPATDAGIRDAYDKLMPSKMLWSIRESNEVIPVVKHEQVLQMFHSSVKPSTQAHRFADENEALAAIKDGRVQLEDEIEIGPPSQNTLPQEVA